MSDSDRHMPAARAVWVELAWVFRPAAHRILERAFVAVDLLADGGDVSVGAVGGSSRADGP